MKFDVIGAVEACYADAADDPAWLAEVLDAVSPLARDSGVQAQVFSGSAFASLSVESRLVRGIPPDVLEECDRIFQGAPLEFWSPVPPVEYATTRARRIGSQFLRIVNGDEKQTLRRHGMEDHLAIFSADLNGRMVGVFINIPAGAPLLPPRVVHRLRSLAAHLTSAVRLRSVLAAAKRDDSGGAHARFAAPEAVLDPAGHAVDANGPARDRAARATLGAAVRLMEKARGRLRRVAPDEALRLWRALVDGTWSLVEHHDSDGKRYLLARRNQPGVREPTALTPGERSVLAFAAMGHQNKYIAYLLGLSPSAVASQLRSAQRKFGLASRGDLIRTFAPVVLAAPEPVSAS